MKIYSDYSEEPEDHFHPLPERLGCDFYNLEMDSYTEDISFYNKLLPVRGLILELGCGSGRISHLLATKKRPFIGIDIDLTCLKGAALRQHPYVQYINMDMVQLGFAAKFTAIVAAYNTLNLLISRESINYCLKTCRELLHSGGRFVAQIFIPSDTLIASNKKVFQFQVFNRPGGGKVIKEILKEYLPANNTVQIEERYRVRPMQKEVANEDWKQTYSVAAFSRTSWLQMFTQAGFTIVNYYNEFTESSSSAEDTSRLLIHLEV